MNLSINTFGLSKLLRRDFDGTLGALKEMGITGLEPCVVFPAMGALRGAFCHFGFSVSGLDGGNWFKSAYARTEMSLKAGMTIDSVHCALCALSPAVLSRTISPAIAYAKEFGLHYIVVSLESGSPQDFEPFAPALARFALQAADSGLRLLYHNHAHELGESDALSAIMRTPEIGLELDVGWALAAGRDPITVLREYADQVSIVHLKDIHLGAKGRARFAAIGEGDLPLAGLLTAADDRPLIIDQDASNGDFLSDIRLGVKNILGI